MKQPDSSDSETEGKVDAGQFFHAALKERNVKDHELRYAKDVTFEGLAVILDA